MTEQGDMPIKINEGTTNGWKHVLWGGVDSSSNPSFTSPSGSNASGGENSEPDLQKGRDGDSRTRLLAELNRRNIDTREVSLRETNSSASSMGPSEQLSGTDKEEQENPGMITWKGICAKQSQNSYKTPSRSAGIPSSSSAAATGGMTTSGITTADSGDYPCRPTAGQRPMQVPIGMISGASTREYPKQPIVLEEALKDMLDDISDEDHDEGDEGHEGMTAEQKKQEQEHQANMNNLMSNPGRMDEELAKVPLDSNGVPTSIGSIGHYDGECRVCLFVYAKPGCMNGVKCSFCHFPHKRLKRKNKMRPCKGKRDRYRKLVIRLTQLIEEDPDGFNLDLIGLPPSIERSETVKEKLRKKMQIYADRVRAQRVQGVSQQQWPNYDAAPEWSVAERIQDTPVEVRGFAVADDRSGWNAILGGDPVRANPGLWVGQHMQQDHRLPPGPKMRPIGVSREMGQSADHSQDRAGIPSMPYPMRSGAHLMMQPPGPTICSL